MTDNPNSPPSCEEDRHYEGSYYGGEWHGRCQVNPLCQRGYHGTYDGGYLHCIQNPPVHHYTHFSFGFSLVALGALAVKSLIGRKEKE
jgi:hypothetical protein